MSPSRYSSCTNYLAFKGEQTLNGLVAKVSTNLKSLTTTELSLLANNCNKSILSILFETFNEYNSSATYAIKL